MQSFALDSTKLTARLKFLALVGLLIVSGLLVGCGGDSTTTTTVASTTLVTPTLTPEPTTPTDTSIASTTTAAPATSTTASTVYTPAKGTAERDSIMDAQRAYMASHGMPSDVVFMIDELRVLGNWAFSEVRPESTDGTAKYESLSFLLRSRSGSWSVVDIWGAAGEEDREAAPTAKAFFIDRNPSVPAGLFP